MKYSFQTYESLICEKRFILALSAENADKRTKDKIKLQLRELGKIRFSHKEITCKSFIKNTSTRQKTKHKKKTKTPSNHHYHHRRH